MLGREVCLLLHSMFTPQGSRCPTALVAITSFIRGMYCWYLYSTRGSDTQSRGTTGSYQRWADLAEDQSFTFDEILPFFKRSINYTRPNYAKRGLNSQVKIDPSVFSQFGGPLQVSYFNYYLPFSKYVARALQNVGLKEIAGANSGTLLGYTETTATLDPQAETRSSSESSFLQQAIATSKIQIYHSTLANRVLFDGSKTAIGVSVTTAGSTYELFANKEVIVSTGVVSFTETDEPCIKAFMLINKVPHTSAADGIGYWARRNSPTSRYSRDQGLGKCGTEYDCNFLFSMLACTS